MKKVINIVLILIVSYACVEPYDFEVKETEEIMVVDVSLTSELKTQQVTLFKSYALDSDQGEALTGAKVMIQEGGDGGKEYTFTETEAGVYSSQEVFGGTPGLSYVLNIEMSDGIQYQSLPEVMPNPVAIDSIYGRYIERNSTETDDKLKGVQFFVDNHNDTEASSSYRFEYREDYEIRVTYPSPYEYVEETDELVYRIPGIGTCYNYRLSSDFLTETTSGLSENRLSEFPVVYVETHEAMLRSQYLLTVYQLSISAGAYQYYKNIRENNESSGSFFDKQKGTVLGNISNVNDPAEPVLGYFEVAAVSSAYQKFSPGDFSEEGFVPERFAYCDYDQTADTVRVDSLMYLDGWGTVDNVYAYIDMSLTYVSTVPATCSDCRYYGVLEKPENWD